MRITLEKAVGLHLIYIYMNKGLEHTLVEIIDSGQELYDEAVYYDVKCQVLFDDKENWLGVRVMNKQLDDDGECYKNIQLPKIRGACQNIRPGVVIETDEYLEIRFDVSIPVHRIREETSGQFITGVGGLLGRLTQVGSCSH